MTDQTVFEAINLTKRYRGATVLDGVNLKLKRGEVYGFVGENGAGKTTLMRLIAGLSYPSEGDMLLFGEGGEKGLRRQRSRLGCMIESPALYSNMTARQNLEMQCLQRNVKNHRCADELLDLVGLPGTGKKTARHFSLGMRQRLGIAMALVGDTEFLILDEPVNGLDPLGVAEIRALMKRLNTERGVTLFVSSHILPELYQTATRYILLHRGRVLEELSLEELDRRCEKCVAVEVHDPEGAVSVLRRIFEMNDLRIDPDGTVLIYDPVKRLEDVSRALAVAGIAVTGLAPRAESLEGYFLRRIEGK